MATENIVGVTSRDGDDYEKMKRKNLFLDKEQNVLVKGEMYVIIQRVNKKL